MITRVWRGWTTHENAAAYEALLLSTIVPAIVARAIPGFIDISVAKCEREDEVEFVTLMWFASLDAVRTFAGDDYAVAVVPAAARAVLARFDQESAHYETPRPPLWVSGRSAVPEVALAPSE